MIQLACDYKQVMEIDTWSLLDAIRDVTEATISAQKEVPAGVGITVEETHGC